MLMMNAHGLIVGCVLAACDMRILPCCSLLFLAAAALGTDQRLYNDVSEHFDAFKRNQFAAVQQKLASYAKLFKSPTDGRLAQDAVVRKVNMIATNDEQSLGGNAPGLFEGDILLTENQLPQILKSPVKRLKRQTSPFVNRWPRPRIGYTFHSTIEETTKHVILAAMEYWEGHTCLSFELDNHGDHLEFFRGSGCYSVVGRAGGKQGISVGWGCETMGIVAHEIGHAIGFWHEQSRADRDDFVRIRDDHVYPGRGINFLQRPANNRLDYDYGSVMHYGPTAFTYDGEFTIETKNKLYQNTIGQRFGLSFLDVKKANEMYCGQRCDTAEQAECENNGYPHPRDCGRCICPDGFSGANCHLVRQNEDRGCSGGGKSTLVAGLEIQSLEVKEVKTGIDCVWLIKAEVGKLHIKVVDANFTCSHTCYGYVELKYLGKYDQAGARVCCQTDLEVSPTNNEAMVIARNHLPEYMPHARFRIEYWRDPTPNEAKQMEDWGEWSSWRPCHGGIQCRTRKCKGKCSKGNAIQVRQDPSSDFKLLLSSQTEPRCNPLLGVCNRQDDHGMASIPSHSKEQSPHNSTHQKNTLIEEEY